MTTDTTNGTITTNNFNCCINSNAWSTSAPSSDSITTTAYPWNYNTTGLYDFIESMLNDKIKETLNIKLFI